jgi:hypothetical protein
MERRNVLKILGIGVITPQFYAFAKAATCHKHVVTLTQLGSQPSQYRLQFFTA